MTYLKDRTGERRFLPIKVDSSKQLMSPFTDLTDKVIDQMWGEFTNYYQHSFSFGLTKEQEQLLTEHREDFMYVDEAETKIDECLNDWPDDFISSSQVAKYLGEENLVKNRRLAKKIKYVMDNKVGWSYVKNPKRGYRKDTN